MKKLILLVSTVTMTSICFADQNKNSTEVDSILASERKFNNQARENKEAEIRGCQRRMPAWFKEGSPDQASFKDCESKAIKKYQSLTTNLSKLSCKKNVGACR